MNFQQLNYCKLLAQKKSFVDAAAACNVTQSTLSNGVAALENELGVKIFARTTRSVMLSAIGEVILPSLLDVLNAKSALVAKAAEISNPIYQIIRIGVSPLISVSLVELILASHQKLYGKINFILREMNLDEMTHALKMGQLDFVLGPAGDDPKPDTDFQTVMIHSEPLIFVPTQKSKASNRNTRKISIEDISMDQFVMVPDTCGLSRCTRALFKRNSIALKNYPGHALSYRVLQDWARIGVGSAIIPLSKLENKTEKILIVEKDKRVSRIEYHAIWNTKRPTLDYLESFGNYLTKTAPKILAGVA